MIQQKRNIIFIQYIKKYIIIMTDSQNTFLAILGFYFALAYLVFPLVFYYAGNKSLISAGHGFAIGSILSVILWYTVGSKMIYKK